MSKLSNGIEEIKIGGDVLGLTEEDSFVIITDDNTTTQNFNSEELDNPVLTITTGSKNTRFEFTIMDPDKDAYETLFDGTITGDDVEIEGVSHILKGVSFSMVPKQGFGIEVAKADVSSRLSDSVGKNSLMGIVVTVTPQGKIKFVDTDSE